MSIFLLDGKIDCIIASDGGFTEKAPPRLSGSGHTSNEYCAWKLRKDDYEKQKSKIPIKIFPGKEDVPVREHIIEVHKVGENLKEGAFESQIQPMFGGFRKIWFTDCLGCSPGFFKSLSREKFGSFITNSNGRLNVFSDSKRNDVLTSFEIDPSLIKRSLHFYASLFEEKSVQDHEIITLKNNIISFIRHLEPISIEDGTFEVIYDESVSPLFLKKNADIRHTTFYPITRDDILAIADICLNNESIFNESIFDEEEKQEIEQSLIEKNFLYFSSSKSARKVKDGTEGE